MLEYLDFDSTYISKQDFSFSALSELRKLKKLHSLFLWLDGRWKLTEADRLNFLTALFQGFEGEGGNHSGDLENLIVSTGIEDGNCFTPDESINFFSILLKKCMKIGRIGGSFRLHNEKKKSTSVINQMLAAVDSKFAIDQSPDENGAPTTNQLIIGLLEPDYGQTCKYLPAHKRIKWMHQLCYWQNLRDEIWNKLITKALSNPPFRLLSDVTDC